MSGNLAFLFPGQGSQFVGMGRDLVEMLPETRGLFDAADEICGLPISRLCFEGPMDELTLTENLQPAITVTSLCFLSALNSSGAKATVSAGHSLGEFGALASAGVLSPHDAIRLVHKRGQLMHRESLCNPGSMAAVLGLEIETVRKIVAEAGDGGVLAVANHNTAEQVVITGERELVARAVDVVKESGGRAMELRVSGAWHCDLMKNAVDEFREFMDHVSFSSPESTVLLNATAQPETDPQRIKDIMSKQLVSPVRWYDIMRELIDRGVDVFVEVGPKRVLTGLLKKIVPRGTPLRTYSVQDVKSLQHFLETFSSASPT